MGRRRASAAADPQARAPSHRTILNAPLARGRSAYLVAAIVVAAFNLRPALVTVGPVLPNIARSLALSPFAQGLLTGLPIFAIGAASGGADRLGRRIGWVAGLVLAAAMTAAGTLLRSAGNEPALYAGALLLGAGIGLGNAFVPALLKAHFASRVGLMFGVYTMVLSSGALLGTAVMPGLLGALGGWQFALGVWGIAAALGALLWLPLLRLPTPGAAPAVGDASIWRSPIAWWVAVTLGLQSTVFYSATSWLPTLLLARGVTPAAMTFALSAFYLAQPLLSLVAPIVLARSHRQGPVASSLMALAGVGLAFTLYGPLGWVWLSSAVFGGSTGAFFGMALTFIVLRARHAATAGRLSGMAQSVGYLIASIGPFLLGLLRAAPDPRLASLIALEALVALTCITAWLAGRNRFVEGEAAAAA